ncbi:U32 family peptidase [Bermanella sp. R86510]|uniref:U32 family peptidase n=1 Tax=unclassified Bermanella TaxID=2627862 RepID=UPI0037C8DE9F
MQVSIGNILFFWNREKVYNFYEKVAQSNASIVYVGESVCSKRRELSLGDWLEIGRYLEASGKQVVLSGLALLEAKSELSTLKKVCDNGNFMVEANDFSAVDILSSLGLVFCAGAALNIYNQFDIKFLHNRGMKRWVMPVELSKDWLQDIQGNMDKVKLYRDIEVEVYAYGYIPLAYSARCFTARSLNLPKDDCRLSCINFPQGRVLNSQEDERLFIMNGIQTLSGKPVNLINDTAGMSELVNICRISPHSFECIDWVDSFLGNNNEHPPISNQDYCNGFWHKIEGMKVINT